MNHNWWARKRCLHLQSVAGISRHSGLSERTEFDNVWHRLGLATIGHRVSVSRHFLLQATQCLCSVRKWFSRDHIAEEVKTRLPDYCESHTRPPEPTSSYPSIDFWCQLVVSPATAASWMSVVAMVCWGYQAGLHNCRVWQYSLPACQRQPSFDTPFSVNSRMWSTDQSTVARTVNRKYDVHIS